MGFSSLLHPSRDATIAPLHSPPLPSPLSPQTYPRIVTTASGASNGQQTIPNNGVLSCLVCSASVILLLMNPLPLQNRSFPWVEDTKISRHHCLVLSSLQNRSSPCLGAFCAALHLVLHFKIDLRSRLAAFCTAFDAEYPHVPPRPSLRLSYRSSALD